MADDRPTTDPLPAAQSVAASASVANAPAPSPAAKPANPAPSLAKSPQAKAVPVKTAPLKTAKMPLPAIPAAAALNAAAANPAAPIFQSAAAAEPKAVEAKSVKAKPVASKTASAPASVGKIATANAKAAPSPAAVSRSVAPVDLADQAPIASDALAEPGIAPALPIPLKPANTAKPSFFKETFAMTTPTFDFAAAFRTAFSDAQEKAKAAYEKGTVAMGETSEFTKGNVEALVESTKILASGLQELTTEMVAESREAFETLTAEVKSLAGVKSPVDFFKLQSELMRKQMDALMANGTKHSEAFLKLASDAAAPLSNRVSLAVEKVKTAA